MTKYDIQTLLAVKPNAHIELDRFSDQAFTNNLVRSNVLSEQSVNRPRNVSGHSRRAVMAPLALNTQNTARQSSQSSLPSNSQFDDAFVRFVEQHTSPKPQRVTAGGRIVPMNPWDSPPKWTLPMSSKGASVANSEASKAATGAPKIEQKSRTEDGTRQQGNKFPESKAGNTAPLPAEAANAPCFQPLANNNSNSAPYASVPLAHQQAQGSGLPTCQSLGLVGDSLLNSLSQPPVATPVMGAQVPTFPFQPQPALTAAPSFPGWNCTSTVAPGTFGPYQPGCFASSSGVGTQWPSIPQASPLPQAAQIPQPPQLPQLCQMPRLPHASPTIGSQPGYNQQFVPSYFQEAIYQKSLEDATKQYDAISEQLSQIDRFTAMHAWVIDPDTKKALVEQRKSLVRELDTVRLYKEHLQVLFGKSQTGNTSGLQKEASPAPVTPSRKGGWESPSKSKSRSLSPTVRNLYRTIEETDERGEPIDGLLHALSGASKGLAKRLTEERANSLAVPSMEVSREVINSTFAMAREEPPRKAPEKGEYVHPVQVSRRLWQSDPHPHSPLLSQCFNKDWSPVLQKSAAPAVSQNVTAHAFLQSFDGAGKTSDDFELV